ncbi:aldehyde dehydrogenase family protein [Herbiconiux moechotypicola]|uniref:aldehyde dehydrogenase (NAD(+)) n=1 Tax=Herbiconiux moechotypicola TaxID=637393 RepID=A0ABP5Q7N3_9MICO|nr:aldehyde dehydrogenase family protein [Herbiconiux moechotypicola]MCS5729135.1 aldehyde dehydrogenase family protein [Herbiconiux moechotypicola]
MERLSSLYIGGEWVETALPEIEVVDPVTESVIATVPQAGAAEVELAVAAAAAAAEEWRAVPMAARAALVAAVGRALDARRAELERVIQSELGSTTAATRGVQVGAAIDKFLAMPSLAAALEPETLLGGSIVVQEPVGVVAAITPWNYPLLQTADKVAAALTAGCTVVLKPSEVTPLNAFVLAEAVHEVGLPAGVFNLVTGYGVEAGEALVAHPLVDMVSFTGSTRAGRRISELAAATVKATAMELGGKSPNLLLDDLDELQMAAAVTRGVASCFPNAGQTCSALTRMIVPRHRLGEVERTVEETVSTWTVGDPRDPAVRIGPLVSSVQRDRVRGYIETGSREGARLLVGGGGAPAGLSRGYYVAPTVFSDVAPSMTIAQEEIFGPVLVIIPVDSEEEAVAVANGTDYGLAAGVWSSDTATATRVARRIRSGIVHVNGGDEPEGAPFGGFKQSGHGREAGEFGLREFLTTKTLCL